MAFSSFSCRESKNTNTESSNHEVGDSDAELIRQYDERIEKAILLVKEGKLHEAELEIIPINDNKFRDKSKGRFYIVQRGDVIRLINRTRDETKSPEHTKAVEVLDPTQARSQGNNPQRKWTIKNLQEYAKGKTKQEIKTAFGPPEDAGDSNWKYSSFHIFDDVTEKESTEVIFYYDRGNPEVVETVFPIPN